MTYLMVKDYAKHQHYRNRNPVWIKLYNALMDDEAFLALPDAARGQLILIWLLASRRQNKLPNDAKLIGRAIQASGKVNLKLLAAAGFLLPWDASTALAHSRDVASATDAEERGDDSGRASLEGEREEEVEGEGEKKTAPPRREREIGPMERELQAQTAEHYETIACWLDERPQHLREEWAKDLLGLIGPATGNTPADLARACTDGKLATPPVTNAKTLRIFLASCREERVRGLPSGAGRSAGSSVNARDRSRGEAGTLFAQIRLLVQVVQQPGQRASRFIRRADVEALGERAVAAYDQVGGSQRFLDEDEKLGFLLRDFTAAYLDTEVQHA